MSMNCMKDIAKMLGVELGEEFKLLYATSKTEIDGVYAICSDDFWRLDTDDNQQDRTFVMLLTGNYLLKKLPWKPKKGDKYYIPSIDTGASYASEFCWADKSSDENRYYSGMVCRDAKEAMVKAEKMFAAIKSGLEDE